MRCGSNRLPPTHPPVHPPLLACLWEISVPASAETAERRNGQVSFVFWHCAVGWDREFESAFLQQRVACEPLAGRSCAGAPDSSRQDREIASRSTAAWRGFVRPVNQLTGRTEILRNLI